MPATLKDVGDDPGFEVLGLCARFWHRRSDSREVAEANINVDLSIQDVGHDRCAVCSFTTGGDCRQARAAPKAEDRGRRRFRATVRWHVLDQCYRHALPCCLWFPGTFRTLAAGIDIKDGSGL